MKMLKFNYDIITGMSYELIDMPYTITNQNNGRGSDDTYRALTQLVTSLANVRNKKR